MGFFYKTSFPPITSSLWLKDKLKMPAKTKVFVASKEKSDKINEHR